MEKRNFQPLSLKPTFGLDRLRSSLGDAVDLVLYLSRECQGKPSLSDIEVQGFVIVLGEIGENLMSVMTEAEQLDGMFTSAVQSMTSHN